MSCSHTFCNKCILPWITNKQTCPVCRAEVLMELTGKDLIANSIIQDLEVQCQNNGCQWTDKLESLHKHLISCLFHKKPEWLSRVNEFIKIDDDTPVSESLLRSVIVITYTTADQKCRQVKAWISLYLRGHLLWRE